jgi:hypothetical protein
MDCRTIRSIRLRNALFLFQGDTIEPELPDENSDEARKKEGQRVFGKGGIIPKLNYGLVGKRDPGFLIKATSKIYHRSHGKPGNKPYPVEVTLEFERIAMMLAKNESHRPAWFNERLSRANS